MFALSDLTPTESGGFKLINYTLSEIEIVPTLDTLKDKLDGQPFIDLVEDYREFRDILGAHCAALGQSGSEDRDWAILSGIFQEKTFLETKRKLENPSLLSRTKRVISSKELQDRVDSFPPGSTKLQDEIELLTM